MAVRAERRMEDEKEKEKEEEEHLSLPPGFRFHPSDEEIITHYLTNKVTDESFTSVVMGEVDLNKSEPWDLPGKAKMGEKEWYFFSHKDRKYPTGTRTNRATGSGYWKATGKDKEIFRTKSFLVGMKKTLVFYKGRAPKGEKTNWVMHEFRLEGNSPHHLHLPRAAREAWVVCKVFHKCMAVRKSPVDELTRMHHTFEREEEEDDDDGLWGSPSLPPFATTPSPLFPTSFPYILSNYEEHNPFLPITSFQAQSSSTFFPPQPQSHFKNLHHHHYNPSAIRGHSQLSHNSTISISHETGLSIDRNMEISSSVMSRDELDSGFDNIWDY